MKTFITALFIWMAISFTTNAQPSEYSPSDFITSPSTRMFDADFNQTTDSKRASFKGQLIYHNGENVQVRMYRIKSNTLLFEGEFTSIDLKIKEGHFTFYYPNGKVESEGVYKNDIKIGEWKRYQLDGSEKPSLYYTDERYSMLTNMKVQ